MKLSKTARRKAEHLALKRRVLPLMERTLGDCERHRSVLVLGPAEWRDFCAIFSRLDRRFLPVVYLGCVVKVSRTPGMRVRAMTLQEMGAADMDRLRRAIGEQFLDAKFRDEMELRENPRIIRPEQIRVPLLVPVGQMHIVEFHPSNHPTSNPKP